MAEETNEAAVAEGGRAVSLVIPALRYADAAAAIDWLVKVFGFERRLVVEGEQGAIVHAQLRLGGGMVMVASLYEGEFGKLLVEPAAVDGKETQTVYLVVENPDEVYERAKEAGAEILIELQDQHYGGRDFTCRDPGGHIWSAGTYNPWGEVQTSAEAAAAV
jgi:uncharacterized glyoxalase superfamily protein PhnB